MRSVLGTRTLLSMQQFIEDAEKDCADEGSELEAKHTPDDKTRSARWDSVKGTEKVV